jgi:hypothetical protein
MSGSSISARVTAPAAVQPQGLPDRLPLRLALPIVVGVSVLLWLTVESVIGWLLG